VFPYFFIPCCKVKIDTGKIVSPYIRPDVELERVFCGLKI
jgi:hypothetical protein